MKTKIETTTATLPSYWASYLINGDASGMDDADQADCDAYLDTLAPEGWEVIDCAGESEFCHSNDAGTLAGDCVEYTLIRSVPYANTLERKIWEVLQGFPTAASFDVVAYELTNDGEGWSVNTPWRIASGANRETVIETARGRWGVFKANYCPRARVRDIRDIANDETDPAELEVDCIPFLQITPAR